MIRETTYHWSEFESGRCVSCGDQCDTILIGTKQCVECKESDDFYEETMKGVI